MMRRTGRRTALVVGAAAAILLLGLAAVFWKDVQASFHLHRLRKDPACFAEALLAPPDSALGAALRVYLRNPQGRTALVENFLHGFLDSDGHRTPRSAEAPPKDYLRSRDLDDVRLGAIGLRSERNLYWWDLRWSGGFMVWGLCTSRSPWMTPAAELLPEIAGYEVALAGHDRLRFKVVRIEDCPILQGKRAALVSNPSSIFHGARGHVLMIEPREAR